MQINFTGKYKSITSFIWSDIPSFVVITGPNGTGKSQLLELIHNTIMNKNNTPVRVQITGNVIKPDEITYLKGEWQLQDTSHIDLSTIQQYINTQYQQFKQDQLNQRRNEQEIKRFTLFQKIASKIGKINKQLITKEEFVKNFPELFLEHENQLSQKVGEVFYNYRLSEIEMQAEGTSQKKIIEKLGEKPWVVLRDIIKESKLPFEINDPSSHGIRDSFQLQLKHTILNESVKFNDLSSGEKVLISLMFYLYVAFPKNRTD